MYAEIKSNNKILINRLDDSEKILLKDILDSSKEKTIKFEGVISDDGEFGGIFVTLEDNIEPEPEPEPEPTPDPEPESNEENNNEEN